MVGINTAKEFGGSPALGAIAGILILNPAVAGIKLFGTDLLPGRGGLIGVLFAAIFIALVEKQVRRYVPKLLIFLSHQRLLYWLLVLLLILFLCRLVVSFQI